MHFHTLMHRSMVSSLSLPDLQLVCTDILSCTATTARAVNFRRTSRTISHQYTKNSWCTGIVSQRANFFGHYTCEIIYAEECYSCGQIVVTTKKSCQILPQAAVKSGNIVVLTQIVHQPYLARDSGTKFVMINLEKGQRTHVPYPCR
jgi:hypothetical protein